MDKETSIVVYFELTAPYVLWSIVTFTVASYPTNSLVNEALIVTVIAERGPVPELKVSNKPI
ncbi:MAG: hypothetical protein ACLQO6_14090 [Desulfomonilaceae bacterium]